jgi:hypothetical protein
MGKKTKNRKKIKNIIPAAVNSEDPQEVLEAHILKLEGQLHEIEMQKEAEIATALETGRKEGYILGCQERLEAVRQVVNIAGSTSRQLSTLFTGDADTKSTAVPPIASAIRTPRDITALHSDSRNPWRSLSRRHCRSHPHKPSVCIRHHPFYTTDIHKHVPLMPSSSTETVEMVQHPYRIGSVKPVIQAPIANPFVALPVHHTPLIPESIAQSPQITFSCYILSKFIPGIVSYSFSIFSQFSVLFWRRRGRRLVRGGTCARERRLWAVFGLVWPFP